MKKVQNILIAGFGDIGRRVAIQLRSSRRYRVLALARKSSTILRDPKLARSLGTQLVRGDLSRSRTLVNLGGLADAVLHFAPPPSFGKTDSHTKNLLAALGDTCRTTRLRSKRAPFVQRAMLPRQIVYISTTGVYGNCDGEWVDETRPAHPESARAERRVDAERRLRKWGQLHGVPITILRAPGIYAADRLPLDRLKRQTPVLKPTEDVFTNHIHADDLATAAISALQQRWPKRFRVFNVVDDNQLRMGDYFDRVADAFGLPHPPRISRLEAQDKIAPMLLSFMRESRRIGNARSKRELKLVLKYPTLASVLSGLQAPIRGTPD